MAPRQYLRKIKTGTPRFENIYQSVAEYRQQYPEKAVAYFAPKYPELAWASFMAGGSCAGIPVTDKMFLTAVTDMTASKGEGYYLLQGTKGFVVYNETATSITLPAGNYQEYTINPTSGEITLTGKCQGGAVTIKGKGVFCFFHPNH
jgi:hypothetical protein